jgi:hypothetical protein
LTGEAPLFASAYAFVRLMPRIDAAVSTVVVNPSARTDSTVQAGLVAVAADSTRIGFDLIAAPFSAGRYRPGTITMPATSKTDQIRPQRLPTLSPTTATSRCPSCRAQPDSMLRTRCTLMV